MSNRIRNINRGLITSPHLYDGYDVLHHTMKKTLQGSTLLPGIYKGKVISVKRNVDPENLYPFEVMVWMPQIHTSIPEPEVYSLVEMKQLHGLKFYKPISTDSEEPCVGMIVNIMLEDPSNAIGYYMNISSEEFDINGDRKYPGNNLIHSVKEGLDSYGSNRSNPNSENIDYSAIDQNNDQKTSEQLLREAKIRITDIDALTPEAKEKVILLLNRIQEENLPFMIWETKRTKLRQKYLYTKSRTTAEVRAAGITEFEGDPKHPWATGTLNSNHLGGNAVDMVLDRKHPYFKGKKRPKNAWDLDPEFMPLWIRYRQLANEVGLKTFGKDWPHASTKRG